MKIPKKTNRYCPYCGKKTEHKIKNVSAGAKRGTLRRGSLSRIKLRGGNRGIGNKGKFSRKPPAQQKRKSKTNKKTNIMYTCQVCKKSHYQRKGKRIGKVIQE